MEVTRRDLFKFTGLAAAGVVGASALAGCAPKTAAETATLADTGSADAGLPAFLQAPEPITDSQTPASTTSLSEVPASRACPRPIPP